MIRKFSILLLLPITLLLALKQKPANDLPGHPKGEDISIEWELVTNNYYGKNYFKSYLTLTNNASQKLENNWELYFTHSVCRKIETDSVPNTIKIIHIAGDLYKIIPTENFPALEHKQQYSIPIISHDFVIKYSDTPSGFYMIFHTDQGVSTPEIITNYSIQPFTTKGQTHRGHYDLLPTYNAEVRYQENLKVSLLPKEQLCPIVPRPFKITLGKDSIELSNYQGIHYSKEFKNEAIQLFILFKNILDIKLDIVESNESGPTIILLNKKKLSFSNSFDAYQLIINQNNGIIIGGNSTRGIFYGIQSLRGLLPPDAEGKHYSNIKLPETIVEDYPQFEYRGMLLDVARNFQPKESVKKLIEGLSFYKINKLQLHLADDEGWRIEIPSLPELTEISSKRGHTVTEKNKLIPAYGSGPFGNTTLSNGYYSRKDFIELLQFANQHHIEIIPAIDLPGHARAAIKAMEARYEKQLSKEGATTASAFLLSDLKDQSNYLSVQQYNDNVICPCMESSYRFLETVIKEIKSMYEESGLRLLHFHIGSDEVPDGVWKSSPVCLELMKNKKFSSTDNIKKYFTARATEIANRENINWGIYEDALQYRDDSNHVKINKELTNKNIIAYSWNNLVGGGAEDLGYKLANNGYKVILMHVSNLYLDQAYTNDPEEPGFYWGGFVDSKKIFEYTPFDISRCAYQDRIGHTIKEDFFNNQTKLSEKGRKNIVGLQAALFSETLKYPGMMEYYSFPKLIAFAERAWGSQPKWSEEKDRTNRLTMIGTDWNSFANQIGQRELLRLNYLGGGFNYQFPAPGLSVENGIVKMNAPFPGLQIRYTLNGIDPTIQSPIYTSSIKANGIIKAAMFTVDGKRGKVTTFKIEE